MKVKSWLSVAVGAYGLLLGARTVPVEWEFPREGSCHEGLAFADGVTGVLAWGGGDTLKLTVSRADLWDHRGGTVWTERMTYKVVLEAVRANKTGSLGGLFSSAAKPGEPKNPQMLPLGRVTVKVPGMTLKSGSLDTRTGLGTLVFDFGGKLRRAELAMDRATHTFAIRFPADVAFGAKSSCAFDEPRVRKVLEPIGFAPAANVDATDGTHGGFTWQLPADPSVTLAWVKDGRTLTVRTSRGDAGGAAGVRALPGGDESCAACVRADFDAVRTGSVDYWTDFWDRGAQIDVPDPVIQRIFDYGMYRFGSMTGPGSVAPGLQGPWIEDYKMPPWSGDYHFNINFQECISPAYRSGHAADLLSIFRMILSWTPILRQNAKYFCGAADGRMLPHATDDRGTAIGGYWGGTIDHGSTAWVASLMYRYVRYTGDGAFLKEAYPFMRGAMEVYLAMMEETPDGRLTIPIGPSPEWGGIGRNPSFQLAAAHRLAVDLIDAAKRLGETPDPRWLDVEKRLPPFCAPKPDAKGRFTDGIQLYEGQTLSSCHRHHSHMAGFYPFDTIDMADPSIRDIVNRTYWRWGWMGTGEWTGWCVPWASILYTHLGNADAAVNMLRSWDEYFCNPGHGSMHGCWRLGFTAMRHGTNAFDFSHDGDSFAGEKMQMDGQCAAATAVMELLAHDVNGKTQFFRGCPERWKDVSFEGLVLSDGSRASGRRLNGNVKMQVIPAELTPKAVFEETKRYRKGPFTVVEFALRPTGQSLINCRLMLPPKEKWTGRFWGVGNVGAGGGLHEAWVADFAGRGEAACDCDLGTSGKRANANRAAWVDFGSRAVHLMTVHAKRLTTEFYGVRPHHSYFSGLSSGGNQAFMEAQRYPEDYDGIVARCPALARTGYQSALRKFWLASHRDGKDVFTKEMYAAVRQAALDVFREASPSWCAGSYLLKASQNPADWNAVLDRAAVLCPALADADLRARWLDVFAAGFPIGGRQVGVDPTTSIFLFRWYTGYSWDFKRPDEPEYAARVFADYAPLVDATDPDLSRFAARGGRIICYSGLGDTLIPYGLATEYYNRCAALLGRERVREFFAYYELPGRGHTEDMTVAGAKKVDDLLGLIVDWVEKGEHPGTVRASLVGSKDKLLIPPYGTDGTIAFEPELKAK